MRSNGDALLYDRVNPLLVGGPLISADASRARASGRQILMERVKHLGPQDVSQILRGSDVMLGRKAC